MGVGQVGAGGGLDRRAGRRGCGVSPGHRAESRGVLARENRGRRWRGPGGGGGRGPSPPGWDGEGAGALGGVFSGSPRRSPRPLSSAATQVGPRPTWGSGRRATSARRARGAQPPSPPPLPGGRRGSSRRAAPARAAWAARAAALLPLLARSLARGGRDRGRFLAGSRPGRGGGGSPGEGGGRGGGCAAGGREGAGEPASERGVCAQLQCASEPAGRSPDTPTEDRQRPEAAPPQPG